MDVHSMFNSHKSARTNPDIHDHAHKTSIGTLSATVQFALPNSKSFSFSVASQSET